MKKTVAILLAVVMLVAVLGSCSSTTDTDANKGSTTEPGSSTVAAPDTTVTSDAEEAHTNENAITDLVVYRTGSDIETFLHVNSENAADSLAGVGIENWIGVGSDGNVTYLVADDYWTNDDASAWTFHLRDGITWVDNQLNYKADLKVTDFLVGAEFILNFYKNSGKCASMLTSNVEGAMEYYEYTKTLTEEEALALTYTDDFAEMVGITADTDANTVTYTCTGPTPYFWSLGYHKCTSPIAEGLVEEIGAGNLAGMSWDKIWYTGAYVISEFVANNTCVLSKNTTYWNYDNVSLFDTVTSNLIESTDTGYQLYLTGEIDYIVLSQSNLVNILSDSSNAFYDKVVKAYGTVATYVMHFNYNKKNADGTEDVNWNTAIANENFRLALYWGLDLEGYYSYKDPVAPFSIAGYTFTQNSFVNVEGMDYQDYVIKLLGLEKSDEYDSRYKPELAQQYMETAVQELTEAGVTFPIDVTSYIKAGNQSSLDQMTLLKTAFDSAFGDYINFEIGTYITSLTNEVISPSLHNFVISGWTADYSDPSNCIEQCSLTTTSNCYLDYSLAATLTEGPVYDLYQEFTALCQKARDINTDLNARYIAYAEAEAFMIEHNLAMPMYMNANWELTNINDYSKALKGQSYQNWETNSAGYTTADYNTFAAEKAAAAQE